MKTKQTLSVVLAVQNEEKNIASCLESVKSIADEIVIVDDDSIDQTIAIAKKYGAKVFSFQKKNNFHEVKQYAIEKATKDWILQLDADERVTPKLANEIKSVLENNHEEYINGTFTDNEQRLKSKMFAKHEKLILQREGNLGKPTGEIVAYFCPRVNIFLRAPLIHAGVYPDGVIRLIKKGKARLPAKSVHELMEVDGKISWLYNDLEHHDSPTFERYLSRANRYTDLTAEEMKNDKIKANFPMLFYYSFIKPLVVFMKLYFRHKGFLDGFLGFVWSIFSALHFPIAYFKYYSSTAD